MNPTAKKVLTTILGGFAIYLIVVFQISVVNYSSFSSIQPNLFYIVTMATYFVFGIRTSLYTAFLGGVLYDTLILGRVGVTSVTVLCVLLFVSFVRRFISNSILSSFLVFYISTFIYRSLISGWHLKFSFIIQGIVDLIILLVMTLVLRYLVAIFNPSSFIQLRFKELK